MDDPFADDDRLQFYLRHRKDILAWAAIRKDVIEATHGILNGLTREVEDQMSLVDPIAVMERHDSPVGRGMFPAYQRIMVRRPTWPASIGVTLEWEVDVDPSGSRLPKYGVFANAGLEPLLQVVPRLVDLVKRTPAFAADGFKTETYWPISRYLPASDGWWEDVPRWRADIVARLSGLWPSVAPVIDEAAGLSSPV